MNDAEEIRDLIACWAVWRDTGDFDRLLTCWHAPGTMVTTYGRYDAAGFVAASRAARELGVDVVHVLGGTAVDVAGDRAVAQTRMTISQRGVLDGMAVDAACIGWFHDLLDRREGRWGLVLRQPIYERDRLDPVEHGRSLELDPELLASFPAGYRHLGYLQSKTGLTVARDLPGRSGTAVDAVRTRGRRWLAGEAAT